MTTADPLTDARVWAEAAAAAWRDGGPPVWPGLADRVRAWPMAIDADDRALLDEVCRRIGLCRTRPEQLVALACARQTAGQEPALAALAGALLAVAVSLSPPPADGLPLRLVNAACWIAAALPAAERERWHSRAAACLARALA